MCIVINTIILDIIAEGDAVSRNEKSFKNLGLGHFRQRRLLNTHICT